MTCSAVRNRCSRLRTVGTFTADVGSRVKIPSSTASFSGAERTCLACLIRDAESPSADISAIHSRTMAGEMRLTGRSPNAGSTRERSSDSYPARVLGLMSSPASQAVAASASGMSPASGAIQSPRSIDPSLATSQRSASTFRSKLRERILPSGPRYRARHLLPVRPWRSSIQPERLMW